MGWLAFGIFGAAPFSLAGVILSNFGSGSDHDGVAMNFAAQNHWAVGFVLGNSPESGVWEFTIRVGNSSGATVSLAIVNDATGGPVGHRSHLDP